MAQADNSTYSPYRRICSRHVRRTCTPVAATEPEGRGLHSCPQGCSPPVALLAFSCRAAIGASTRWPKWVQSPAPPCPACKSVPPNIKPACPRINSTQNSQNSPPPALLLAASQMHSWLTRSELKWAQWTGLLGARRHLAGCERGRRPPCQATPLCLPQLLQQSQRNCWTLSAVKPSSNVCCGSPQQLGGLAASPVALPA